MPGLRLCDGGVCSPVGPASDAGLSVEEVSRPPVDLGDPARTARSVTAPMVLVAVSAAAARQGAADTARMSWLMTLRETNRRSGDQRSTAT
jgi:hypothetical protein